MGEMLRHQAESWREAIQQYRRGLIPVHALCLHFKLILSRWFIEAPRVNIDESHPQRCLPLLTRHAALAGDQPVRLESNQELFLDVTTILLLQSLKLLGELES